MKKLISLLLCLCLMGAFFVTPVWADEDTETETEPVVRQPGQCGEDLYWSFAGGTLTITGSGKMDDFEEGAALGRPTRARSSPWYCKVSPTSAQTPSATTMP